jgi:large subunit ribosomal protein L3
MVEVGAVDQPRTHRLRKPQLFHFRRHGVQPKKKITEFKVSPDACLNSGGFSSTLVTKEFFSLIEIIGKGMKLEAGHFVAGQYVDCQGKTYLF